MLRKHLSVIFGLIFLTTPMATQSQTANQPKTGIHTFAASSVLAEGRWVRISIPETGIYQITDAELRKMGFTDPSKVGVFGFGGEILDEAFSKPHIDDLPEIAIYRDEAKKRILFYGRGVTKWEYSKGLATHRNNPYAREASYFLHQKGSEPLRIEKVDSYTTNPESYATTFSDYALHEVDATSLANTGREMYGESFVYTRAQGFKFSFPGITADPASIDVDFAIHTEDAGSILKGTLDGDIEFLNSNLPLGVPKYGAARKQYFSSQWNPKNDNITVTLVYKPGGSNTKVAALNYIRLNVTRKLQLYGNYTLFRNPNAKAYLFEGTTWSNNFQIWDLSDAQKPKQVIHFLKDNQPAFSRPVAGGEHAIVNLEAVFPAVTKVGEVANQNLHALPQTDMVIIVQPKLRAQAERLAEYRRTKDKLHVTVVTPQDIYNEFSSGTPDGTAYRLFMKMFYDRAVTQGTPPAYLLLFGDGAVDNRGMESTRWKPSVLENCLLTYQSDPSLVETESYVCDDYFGFLDDNEGGSKDYNGQYTLISDKLDVGIGRLPVRTLAEAKAVVNKIIAYSENKVIGNWKNNLCFLGDDGDNATHMRHADDMVSLIQSKKQHEFVFSKIYLDSYKREMTASGTAYPVAKKKFFDQLQQGALIVNYSGHGATTSITHEKLFMLADARDIIMKRLPVWITATCDFSRFDDYDTSAGEALLLNPDGGASALFTTTRVVYSNGNLNLNTELINNLFVKHDDGTRYRLGDVMKLAKCALGTELNKLNFLLLGDPAMTMAYPEYRMEITEVNGKPVSEAPVVMKALSKMTFKGRVLELGSDATATHFNGMVYPSVYDSEETVTALDNDKTGKPFVFKDRTRKLFAGSDSVRNGEFEFSFVVPKDISYSMQSGMMNLYASGSGEKEAQGYFDGYLLGGTVDEMETDTIGPRIRELYLNNDSFKDGDVVNATPYLFAEIEDETGINTTGASVGHDLVATIYSENSAPVKYTLNSYFLTAPGSASRGSLGFSIPVLADGEYTLELKAWDVYNNSSVRAIRFTVKNSVKPMIFDLRSDRNPVREEVSFLLTHNRPESRVKARIQVYTQMGQCVWDQEVNGMSEFLNNLPVTWDLRTSSGNRVLPGIYIYRALLSSDGEHYATKSKKLIVLGE
ncbi:MAG: type IX secretion system sortase PorU [Bacteroidales bacterium]